ncbi:hypothetical protein FACS1894166_00480 [Bacilli bacterium]|nr:hypothetical protein FACS1894166_00480 [Bacilli bacterium]
MTIKIHVIPNAKKTEMVGEYADMIKIKVKAPAVDNKANEMLIKFLAKHYQVSRASVTIIRGFTSRNKVIAIDR